MIQDLSSFFIPRSSRATKGWKSDPSNLNFFCTGVMDIGVSFGRIESVGVLVPWDGAESIRILRVGILVLCPRYEDGQA